MDKAKLSTALIETGGFGLVMFHLARCGIESVRTIDRSAYGDIWAMVNGQPVTIEVKTGTKMAWSVARAQRRADFYCFVHLFSGLCYVLTAAEVERIMSETADRYPGTVQITVPALPPKAANGWDRFGIECPDRLSLVKLQPGAIIGMRKRYVRRADGTVKTYVYPRRAPRILPAPGAPH